MALNRVLPRRGGSGRLKRVESAPSLLTPVWEPEHGEEAEEPPPAMPSRGSLPTYSASSLDLPMLHRECKSDEGALQPRWGSEHLFRNLLPPRWAQLLGRLGQAADASQALGMLELVAAASERLQSDPLPLEVSSGLVEESYQLKRELSSGRGFRVVEGVALCGQRNYSLKFVHGHGVRATRPLDTMQCLHLITSFVGEVFAHPTFVCVVMRWGMHEVDGSHQLAAVIAEAVRLLRELLPSGGQSRYLRLSSSVLQRLLLRMACLDSHLGDSLWLP